MDPPASNGNDGSDDGESWNSQMGERRQQVASIIHSLWTSGGSDVSALAPALLEGRVDAMGLYCFGDDDDDDERPDDLPADSIDRIHCRDLTYSDFFSRYMLPNRPVIIQGLTESWKSKKEWTVFKHGREEPNLEYLSQHFGNDVAPVHEQQQGGFTLARPQKQEETLSEYAEWWYEHEETCGSDGPLRYLKDWKFVAVHPSYNAYDWPEYFQDDWLNGAMGNAYKFVYLGPAGTCTRLHADVLRSFSWSTNVCGRKRWYLVPPQYTYLLYDCFGASLASHLHADQQDGVGLFFPGLAKARRYAVEIIQESGETIFVPSGWHHTVENLAPTLSINHNWLNGTNVHWSWEKLRSEIEAAHKSAMDSSRSERHSENDTLKTDVSNDPSQIGDDLLLLWMVLSRKAQAILMNDSLMDDMAVFNLSAILPILEGIHEMIRDGKDQGLTERSECNIVELIAGVKAKLNT